MNAAVLVWANWTVFMLKEHTNLLACPALTVHDHEGRGSKEKVVTSRAFKGKSCWDFRQQSPRRKHRKVEVLEKSSLW